MSLLLDSSQARAVLVALQTESAFFGIVGAFFGLLILFVIASMAINQILWS